VTVGTTDFGCAGESRANAGVESRCNAWSRFVREPTAATLWTIDYHKNFVYSADATSGDNFGDRLGQANLMLYDPQIMNPISIGGDDDTIWLIATPYPGGNRSAYRMNGQSMAIEVGPVTWGYYADIIPISIGGNSSAVYAVVSGDPSGYFSGLYLAECDTETLAVTQGTWPTFEPFTWVTTGSAGTSFYPLGDIPKLAGCGGDGDVIWAAENRGEDYYGGPYSCTIMKVEFHTLPDCRYVDGHGTQHTPWPVPRILARAGHPDINQIDDVGGSADNVYAVDAWSKTVYKINPDFVGGAGYLYNEYPAAGHTRDWNTSGDVGRLNIMDTRYIGSDLINPDGWDDTWAPSHPTGIGGT